MSPRYAMLALLALADCSQFSRQPPVTDFLSVSGSPTNSEPQPPNSLPLGSQVHAPFTPIEGNLNRVALSLPPPPPSTGPGYIPAVPIPSP